MPFVPPQPVELVPRAQAPERVGFDAMRALANLSARSAIDTSNRKQAAREAGTSWGITAIGLLAAGGMAYMGYRGLRFAYLGSLAGLVVAGYWGSYAIVSFRGYLRRKKSLPKISSES